MKGKRLLILGAAFALGLSACAGAVQVTRMNPFRAETANQDGTYYDTISGGTVSGSGTSATITWTIGSGNITIISRSGGGNAVANTDRLYRYNYVEVSASNDYSIVNLQITYSGNYRGANNAGGTAISNNRISAGQSDVTVSDTNVSGGVITVTPNSNANTHFYFQNAATGDTNTQLRWTEFKINYSKPSGATPATYSVTYNNGGATSGSVPEDDNEYESGELVTVLGNTNNLAKDGYEFGGWSFDGNEYKAGDKIEISSNITLTAIWNYLTHYTDDTSASTITWDLTNPEYVSASKTQVCWESPKATMTVDKASAGSDANAYMPPSQSSTRFYKNSTLSIAPVSGYQIDSIVFSATTTDYAAALSGSTWSNATASVDSKTVTIVPTIKKNAVSATIGGTSGHYTAVVHYSTISLEPTLSLSQTSITLLTTNTDGIDVIATVENVESPTYLWSTNDSNIELEGVTTSTVTIKPNTSAEGSATVNLLVGGTNPNLTASVDVEIELPEPGTQDNPYTVSQAKAAIDAGTGITDVYVKGIISQIDSYDSSHNSITYWISEDGTTNNQFEVYSGKGLDGANFTSIDQVELCASVIVRGDIKKYGSVYEFNYNNKQVSYVVPSLSSIALSGNFPTEFIAGDDFSHEGMVVTATFENGASKIVESGFDFSGYNMSSAGNQTVTVSYTKNNVTKTADYNIVVKPPKTLTGLSLVDDTPTKVSYFGGEQFEPAGLVVYGIWDDEVDTSENIASSLTWEPNPLVPGNESVTGTYRGKSVVVDGLTVSAYTVAQAISAIDAGSLVNGVYVKGIISQVDSYNSTYHSITYWISDDGTTTNQFQVYGGLRNAENPFSSKDDIEVGASVVVCGNIKKYNSTYEFDKNNTLFSYQDPVFDLNRYLESAESVATIHASEDYALKDNYAFSSGFSSDTTFNSENPVNLTSATLVMEKSSGSYDPKYVASKEGLRLYAGNTITITATGSEKLSRIIFDRIDGDLSKLTVNGGSISSGVWTGSENSIVITNSDSKQINISGLEISYGNLVVGGAAMRFGVKITQNAWSSIDSNCEISEYGVMLFKRAANTPYPNLTVEEAYSTPGMKYSVVKVTSGSLPDTDDEGNYVFCAQVNISSAEKYDVVFCAQAYVIIDGQIHFLDEMMECSVHSLANSYVGNTNYQYLSQDALNILAGN